MIGAPQTRCSGAADAKRVVVAFSLLQAGADARFPVQQSSPRLSTREWVEIYGFPKQTARATEGVAIHVLKNVGASPRRGAILVLALPIVGVALYGVALAQAQRTGGPTKSGPGAEVYFIDLKDGATVPAKLKLYFGLRNMGVAPAGSDRENSGHHHLLIDTELPPLDQPIPNDFNHLHFGAGQTEAEV